MIDVVGAGEMTVDVDGEGPDVTGITPEDLSYLRPASLQYSFVVRDEDAGLRHDGESVITQDGDYTEVNPDGDHATTREPLSTPSGGQISVNGEAAEIDLKVGARRLIPTLPTTSRKRATGRSWGTARAWRTRSLLMPRAWTRARTSWR